MKAQGIEFLRVPVTYYRGSGKALRQIDEPVSGVAELGILVDPRRRGLHTPNLHEAGSGPAHAVILQVIRHKGSRGFGKEGFRALFESDRASRNCAGICRRKRWMAYGCYSDGCPSTLINMNATVHRLPITKARVNLGQLVRRVDETKSTSYWRRTAYLSAGIMGADELEDYLELQDQKFRNASAKAMLTILAGRSRPAKDFLTELRAEARGKKETSAFVRPRHSRPALHSLQTVGPLAARSVQPKFDAINGEHLKS